MYFRIHQVRFIVLTDQFDTADPSTEDSNTYGTVSKTLSDAQWQSPMKF